MKNKDNLGSLVDIYKYSLKRRISATYALVYVIVSIFVLSIFAMLFLHNGVARLVVNTGELSSEIFAQAKQISITSDDFRYYLNSLRLKDNVEEIYIIDSEKEIVSGTTMSESKIEQLREHSNILDMFFPNLSKIKDGYYLDIVDFAYGNDNEVLNLVVCYSLDNIIEDIFDVSRALIPVMAVGLFIFILAGYMRTNRMLKPIAEITGVAKKISGENLELRIDEKGTNYELNELAATINSMMDRIQTSYDKQKRFVSDVSHELRTPIAVISGYGSMLKRWGKSDEAILEESIEAIISESDNMKELVEKLLFLTRNDNDNITFDMNLADISELASLTVKEETMVHPEFTFDAFIEPGILSKVDSTRLKQAVRIFLDNAVKYSGDSHKVEVRLETVGRNFSLSVKDFGIGIAKKDLPNIFERFYRADTSRTKETGGYGLGLAIAKIIVSNHRGIIRVRTKEGEGSEFRMVIPLSR